MSRSKKGGKSPGYEFWSARPTNKHGGGVGRTYKKLTHQIERAQAKQELLKEPHDPEWDERKAAPGDDEE